jgi:superfamily II DNA or RNA helicase
VVQHWLKHAKGMRTVGFACNVAHSHDMVAAFNAQGIPAAHLDGGTPKGERKRIIAEFAAGRIQVLWNVALFGEGFDLSAIAQTDVTIDCVILNRKTQSISLFLQMMGRALRPFAGKVAVILDHADNTRMHGFPDDEREWKLEGSAGKKAANDNGPPPPVTCDGCFMQIRRPTPAACPHCGKKLLADAKPIAVADGELGEITEADKRKRRQEQLREQADAKTLDELISLARSRGYKEPIAWARKVFYARMRKAA